MDPKKNKRRAVVVRTRGLSPRAVATENSGRFQNQQDTVRPCNVDEFLVDGLFADHRSRARGRTPEQDGRSQASAKPKRRGALRLTSWLESRRSTCCSSHNCFAKLRHAPQLPKAFSSQVDNVWSRDVARWFRYGLSVAGPFVRRCLTSLTMLP